MKHVSALVVGIVMGCAAVMPSASAPPRPCCVNIRVRHDPAFDMIETEAITEAQLAWTRGTYGGICFVATDNLTYDLAIIRGETVYALRPYDPRWRTSNGVYRNGVAVIVVGGASGQTITAITAHEIGHYLKLEHNERLDSVMHESRGRLDNGELPEQDRMSFFSSHGECR